MPVTIKPHECAFCGETDPLEFWSGRKSCCKECLKITSYRERRNSMLLPYKCRICGDMDEGNFYRYCKNKCREHYNYQYIRSKPLNIVIVKSTNASVD